MSSMRFFGRDRRGSALQVANITSVRRARSLRLFGKWTGCCGQRVGYPPSEKHALLILLRQRPGSEADWIAAKIAATGLTRKSPVAGRDARSVVVPHLGG